MLKAFHECNRDLEENGTERKKQSDPWFTEMVESYYSPPRLSVLVPPFSNFSPLYRVRAVLRKWNHREINSLPPRSRPTRPTAPTHSYRSLDRPNFKSAPVRALLYIWIDHRPSQNPSSSRRIHVDQSGARQEVTRSFRSIKLESLVNRFVYLSLSLFSIPPLARPWK